MSDIDCPPLIYVRAILPPPTYVRHKFLRRGSWRGTAIYLEKPLHYRRFAFGTDARYMSRTFNGMSHKTPHNPGDILGACIVNISRENQNHISGKSTIHKLMQGSQVSLRLRTSCIAWGMGSTHAEQTYTRILESNVTRPSPLLNRLPGYWLVLF